MQRLTETLSHKIENRTAEAVILGLGYVGLPLAVAIAKAGYPTTGIDISREKVNLINAGNSFTRDVDNQTLGDLVQKKKLMASSDFSHLSAADFISICVPTPLGKGKNPDMSFILQVLQQLKKHLRQGQAIILESTTYPGTTNEVVIPLLEETGLKAGRDFHLAFSPERIDPGNSRFGIKNTPKIVGGVTQNCTEIVQSFYQTFVDRVIPVSSAHTAEMVKILENTFRAINIGLANEVAIMCNHLGIDTWEVIEAAATKPFGFMPFYPGPGLGGHCIPVDPHYLVWKLKSLNYDPRFIRLADEINSSMPHLVVEKVTTALNDREKSVKGSKILILGIAYKKDIDDFRESPSLDVIRLLQKKGAQIFYHDPYIPHLHFDGMNMESTALSQDLSHFDCLVLLTNHSQFDTKKLVEECQLFVDTRNATKGIQGHKEKIVKL